MELDPLRFAKFFATVKHGRQTYGNLPYTHHLAAVEEVLRRFLGKWPGVPIEHELLEAAWLHDVVEDTDTKIKEVAEMFGPRVAELVWAVTSEPGANREIRNALTYPKIRTVPGATGLKLADRIANVEKGGDLVKMYAKEYEDFRWALRAPEFPIGGMWVHLDGLLGWK